MRARLACGLLISASILAGCAVGPNFHAPAAPTSSGYGPGDPTWGLSGQTLNRGAAAPAEWWRAFGSPELDAMVQEALAAIEILPKNPFRSGLQDLCKSVDRLLKQFA